LNKAESKEITTKLSIEKRINERLYDETDPDNYIKFEEFESAVREGIDIAIKEIGDWLLLRTPLTITPTPNIIGYSIADPLIQAGMRLLQTCSKELNAKKIEYSDEFKQLRYELLLRRRVNITDESPANNTRAIASR
jgi:hypothetical protein